MRHATACLNCRSHKRRCVAPAVPGVCTYCHRKGITCSLAPSATQVPTRSPQTPVQDSESKVHGNDVDLFALYGESFLRDTITIYLSLIHDRPHSLFHISTLWKNFDSRSIEQPLLLCLCAFGARLSSALNVVNLGPQLTLWARQATNSQIDNICLQNVQSCILLANICAADLQPSLEALYFGKADITSDACVRLIAATGVANRMAHILRLNRTNPSDSAVLQETKCRVWWTLVMADNWCSAGLGIPRQLHTQGKCFPLPRDESDFQRWSYELSSAQVFRSEPGLWAYMIQLVDVFGPINDLNHQIVEEAMSEAHICQRVQHLSERLDNWQLKLPMNLKLSPKNLEAHRMKDLGGPFVALHLGFFHYYTLLYFRYLNSEPEDGIMHVEYGRRCKQLAWSYSNLLLQSRLTPRCETVYATVGHMTVVSSSVLLHTLLFGEEEDLLETRKHLTSNFAALIELKKYWPCLERTMTRLLDFQESCRRNAANTHHVDEWMIRFLIEHSLPLDSREKATSPQTFGNNEENAVSSRTSFVDQALASLWNSPTTQ